MRQTLCDLCGKEIGPLNPFRGQGHITMQLKDGRKLVMTFGFLVGDDAGDAVDDSRRKRPPDTCASCITWLSKTGLLPVLTSAFAEVVAAPAEVPG